MDYPADRGALHDPGDNLRVAEVCSFHTTGQGVSFQPPSPAYHLVCQLTFSLAAGQVRGHAGDQTVGVHRRQRG